jgi:ankyrin repeat protein
MRTFYWSLSPFWTFFASSWTLSFLARLPKTTIKNTPRTIDISPEFDRLKRIREISLSEDLVMFIEKSYLLLQSRRGLKRRDQFKRSLLYYAAIGNCTNLLHYLLQNKLDIDSRDIYGRTPLSCAAEYGSFNVVKILLERGVNINAMDYKGSTLLI